LTGYTLEIRTHILVDGEYLFWWLFSQKGPNTLLLVTIPVQVEVLTRKARIFWPVTEKVPAVNFAWDVQFQMPFLLLLKRYP